MRAKQLWSYLPLPSKIKLVWQRITLSKLTTFYFLFSLFHFAVQLVLQAQAFDINATAATVLFNIVQSGHQFVDGFVVNRNDALRVCDAVPTTYSVASCKIVYPVSANDTNVYPGLGYNMSVPSSTSVPASTSTSASSSTSSTVTSASASATASSSANATASADFSISSSNSSLLAVSGDDEEAVHVVTTVVTVLAAQNTKAVTASKRKVEETSVTVTTSGTMNNVTLNGFGWTGQTEELSSACLVALNWPVEKLDNTKREDVTTIAFEFWVFGMSVVALLNESIPHVVAALLTHVFSSLWGAYQLYSTGQFRDQFDQLSDNDGPCAGVSLLVTYWTPRIDAEIASLALNVAALLVSSFLTWKLVKAFGWQTFKRVGASRTINFVYKIILFLSIALQLSLFFMVASMALWIDQLYNGAIGHLARNQDVFKGLYIAAFFTLVPWLILGWHAARHEKRKLMLAFIALSFIYIALWGVMWISPTFRWTFITWPFFASMFVIALLLMLVTFVLAIVSRHNFGKGLPHYLKSMDPLPGDDFVSAMPEGYGGGDPEKVDFPSDEMTIPTFSITYGGKGEMVPPPSQMHLGHAGGRRVSPIDTSISQTRSLSSASSPEDTPIQRPVESHLRLDRQDTRSSQNSVGSSRSGKSSAGFSRTNSTSSGKSHKSGKSIGATNRWVIE